MTREEAIKKLFDVSSDLGLVETIEARIIIEEIFDDFESRVCKNCKYVGKHENGDEHKCEILMATTREEAEKLIDEKFGCNRFERRKYERN